MENQDKLAIEKKVEEKTKESSNSTVSGKNMDSPKQPLMSRREKAWGIILAAIWFIYCLLRAIFDDNWWWR